jgi:hypothetical protein
LVCMGGSDERAKLLAAKRYVGNQLKLAVTGNSLGTPAGSPLLIRHPTQRTRDVTLLTY